MNVSWFSAGVSSAVATKIAIDKFPDLKILYTHIDDQHEDTMRFLKDCEKWFGREVEITQSPLKTVSNACLMKMTIRKPYWAPCTELLKKRVRQDWESDHKGSHTYIWGMDVAERDRSFGIKQAMPKHDHCFPLIENCITKDMAHGILEKEGIKRPMMYDLGYPNNNCIGCLKGGMGYWNKIRVDFPEVFKQRCELEKTICGRIFQDFDLKDLDKERGIEPQIIVPDCGLFCEIDK